MSAGNEGDALLAGVRKLAGVLDSEAPRDFLWQFEHMPQETHGSVSYRSVYKALQFVFANWALRNPFDVYTRFGLEAVEHFYAIGDQRYGFKRGVPQVTLAYLLGDMVRAGELDNAVTLMSKPSAMQNAQISTITFLADALRNNGDQDQATIFYRQVLAQNPGNTIARNALDEMGADYSDVVPNPRIDDETLNRYVGAYFNERVGDISILSEDGRLYLEMNGGRVQLLPLNDSEFYRLGSDIQYSFQVSVDGEVRGVQLRQGDFELYVERR